ncbi:MAG: riboflavin synthase [Deltaproteobacteria bacterium]|nr:riboflavin synthase [Deltaproteobacteria bacterium]MBW2205673.1 riboflavin synthase [Deltaproteobacteria bacterium]
MFTGLVEGIGRVKEVRLVRGDMSLVITPGFDISESAPGDSIAVNGVCLTVTDMGKDAFSLDVSGETLVRSTMKSLKPGDDVNLERALRLSDRLGGHLVSGHVDGVGRIVRAEQRERYWLLRIEIEEDISRYTIEKGSIAVDGISLTINRCGETFFEVNIIPQTSKETIILKKRVGDLVNIETDLIGKYVEKFFTRENPSVAENHHSSINEKMLKKYGFQG